MIWSDELTELDLSGCTNIYSLKLQCPNLQTTKAPPLKVRAWQAGALCLAAALLSPNITIFLCEVQLRLKCAAAAVAGGGAAREAGPSTHLVHAEGQLHGGRSLCKRVQGARVEELKG